jgi:hypothetical protein
MGDRAIFVDDSNETRLSGELAFPESTPTDVLTVQADGSIAAAPGGGSMPAGADTQIQFNDADAFGASPDFVWDDTDKILKLVTGASGTAQILGNGLAVELQIAAGDGDAANNGGTVAITAGRSDGQNGGDVTVEAGLDQAGGTGGGVTISSGNSTEADSGVIDIKAGGGATAGGDGGQVNIQGGNATGAGGGVQLTAGSPDGWCSVASSDLSNQVYVDGAGVTIYANAQGFFGKTAVAQPVVPLTAPLVQDVIDALLAVGLVTQSD